MLKTIGNDDDDEEVDDKLRKDFANNFRKVANVGAWFSHPIPKDPIKY